MGRVLLIGVVVLTLLMSLAIRAMQTRANKLPEVHTKDILRKEAQQISDYAIHYGIRYAEEKQFVPPPSGVFYRKLTFNNFLYRSGRIDSIVYNYIPASTLFRIRAYSRTTVNGVVLPHMAEAGVRNLHNPGGKGNLAHWSMDTNFLDSSGNGNDGIGYNGVRFQNNGLSNAAVFVDGRNDYVGFNDTDYLDMPINFTISVWANWNSDPSGYIPIIWKASMPNDPSFVTKPAYGLWLYQDHLVGSVLTTNLECIRATTVATYQPPQGTWHLVTLTYNGQTVKIYYDGAVVAQATGVGGPIFNSSEPVTVGRIQNSTSYLYFKGRMDEIGIYDFVLTDAQILSIWNSPNGILPTGTANPAIIYVKN